jgi:two-component system, NarL family, invasion response regulator UvrY
MLVDDHPIVREGLRHVLSRNNDVQIVAEADNGAQALEILQRHECDIVLLDIALPDQSGLVLLRQIKKLHPPVHAIMLSSYSENDYAMTSLRDGASGYVMKTAANEELATAIRVVAAGGKYLSPRLLQNIGGKPGDTVGDRQLFSRREKQVLQLLILGKRLTEIGAELNLSIKTISTYRTRILQKTGTENNAELVRFAFDRGLIF